MGLKILVKFYDKDVLKNITAVLTLKPEKIIYIYDSDVDDLSCFLGLEKCFKRHMPDIIMEKYPVNILDMEQIYETIKTCMNGEGDCGIGLTGGSELMMIAGYRAGIDLGIDLFYTDLPGGVMMDLRNNKKVNKIPALTLADFLDARGACSIGNSHIAPTEDRFRDILEMSRIIFENLEQWKQTCGFFQTVVSRYSPADLEIQSQFLVVQKNGRKVVANKNLLYAFQKLGFIRDLRMTKENVKFSFVNITAKQYAINYGIWLELFVYIHAKKTGVFDDVQLGMMIDWDAYDGMMVAGNEIDVLLCDYSLPVFISCKLRSADTAALNELVIAKKRIGGWFSKGVIVTFGNDKQIRSGTYKRAKEMGIELLDAEDIMSGEFGDRLVKSIREHNLVSMKWKKI